MSGMWNAIALSYILSIYGPKGKPLELKRAGLPFRLNTMINLTALPVIVLLALSFLLR